MSDGFIIKRGGGGGDSNAAFKAMVTRSITEVTADMLQGITSIGGSAFSGCSSLGSITLPSSVTSIGSSAFSNCTSLASITIPNGVTSIGKSVFSYCSSLASITLPSSVTYIGSSSFMNSNLTSLIVKATTPPTVAASFLFGTSSSLTIYVPSESVSTYKSTGNWSNHSSKIQAIPSN